MNAPNDLRSQFADCSFAQLTDVYRLLKQKGETLDVAALVDLAPHLEKEILEKFPFVAMLDDALAKGKTESTISTIPNTVAGCILKEEIGRGGMGVVFRAHQPELNRDVAVKVIQLSGDVRSQKDRFELERHALARLEHPNVIPAYSFTQDDKYAYLVMKLISGYGLNQLMNNEGNYKTQVQITQLRSDWSSLARMGADVASGLQHAHENGLIHRDIKPANLLIDQDSKVWISDFGLAKMNDFAHAISMTGDVVGTPKYMAPEQIQGVCDPRTDIYSLGMTLYELASGQSARGSSWKPNQWLEGSLPQVQDVRELNPDIPEGLAHVIMKCCRFLPEDRYQSAEELEIVLRRFLDGRVADRRKKKRKPDAIYRKEFRRKASLSIVGSMLACAAITFFAMAPKKNEAVVASTPSSTNILDALADGQRHTIDEHFVKALRDEIVKASTDLQLPESERNELVTEMNVAYERAKGGKIGPKEMRTLIQNYRNSNLGMATRVWRTQAVIQKSKMSDIEKAKATKILQRFAYVATKQRMAEPDANKLLNSLTNGRSVSGEELRSTKFSTTQVRKWIAKVDNETKPLIQPGEEVDVSREIRNLFKAPDDFSSPSVKQYPDHYQSNGGKRQKQKTFSSNSIPRGITEADVKKIESELSPDQIKQLKARFNGLR
ncbi:MAG: serine/threonine protein kinase [Mariniblastus sp.]